MKIEDGVSTEPENIGSFSDKKESVWNQHHVTAFQQKREKELTKLNKERPSKLINPQVYYNYRAREEQIKYELDFRAYCLELLKGNFFEALINYGHAINHLKRRGNYEKRLYAIWLERIKAQENPPTPDILFINQGIRINKKTS